MTTSDMLPSPSRSEGSRRPALMGLVLAWGVQAIVTQSLLLREALVLMFGSEFAWGVVLFAWLLGVSVGAAAGGAMAGRVRRPGSWLVAVLLLLSAAACADLWLFRGARAWLGVGAGELLPVSTTAVAALVFVSPVGALVGLAFPLACCVRGSSGEVLHLSNVYALESAGSLIGGAAFSFWAVEHLTPIQTALTCGALTAAASAGFVGAFGRRRLGALGLGSLALGELAAAMFAGEALNQRLVARRWAGAAPGYELVAELDSKYQNLALRRRADQFTLYCDGQVAADFPDPYTYIPLAHFWMCQHPSPAYVLVLGGGAEGLLAEILRHPVGHVDYVEPDPRQIELIEPHLADADRRALADPRVTVHHVDARLYVKTQRDRFDLVVARLPEPTSALRARFYTAGFYGELRRAMTPRSVLCMTAAASPNELSAVSAEYLGSIRAALLDRFPEVIVSWGDPAQVLAATAPRLITIEPAELIRRYEQRGIDTDRFDPAWFDGATDWLAPDKVSRRATELDAVGSATVSTDLHPDIYLQRLVLWDRMTGGRAGRVVEWLRSIRLGDLIAVLALVAMVTLVGCRLGRGRAGGWAAGAVIVSVGSTGFATMALSMIWLFAFQNLYGYVYQRIGWIIALFMGGLVAGCALAGRRADRARGEADAPGTGSVPTSAPAGSRRHAYLVRRLVAVDVVLAVGAAAIPFILRALGGLQTSPAALLLVEVYVSVMVALTGLLGGAAFALAGRLQLSRSTSGTAQVAAAAGAVDSADHAGACLGALLCGILLVPVYGTATAAFLLGGIKIGSAILLVATGRTVRSGQSLSHSA